MTGWYVHVFSASSRCPSGRGLGRGEEGGREEEEGVLNQYACACCFPWNIYGPLLAARCQKVDNARPVLRLYCSFADTLVPPTRGGGRLGRGGRVVIPL